MKNNIYRLKINALEKEKHVFKFILDNNFFAELEDFDVLGGSLEVEVETEKTEDELQINLAIDGNLDVVCDRCLDAMTIPIDNAKDSLTAKMSEAGIIIDELVADNNGDGEIDLEQYLRDLIVLQIPIKKRHRSGECNIEMEEIYRKMEEKKQKNQTDPRWESLKNINK